MVILSFIFPCMNVYPMVNAILNDFTRFSDRAFFVVYNTSFLSVASGEVFNAGQSFDAGDRKGYRSSL
ncbi:hypothetical protein DRY71_22715 [Salmonella enterica subsp. enterica serovar Newport]|uniref:Uncharacterized protein n=1 Tax=Salmonella newport TaxID=108619 RepID=A0A5U9KW73_SALNE|nr:hypothetical protein [Salmonella enterica subsp. enterica serovar Newport]